MELGTVEGASVFRFPCRRGVNPTLLWAMFRYGDRALGVVDDDANWMVRVGGCGDWTDSNDDVDVTV